MNYESVYFRVIRGELLIFFTTDCTEITDVLTDFNSSYTHVPGVPGSSFYQCSLIIDGCKTMRLKRIFGTAAYLCKLP